MKTMGNGKQKRKTSKRKARQEVQRHLAEVRRFQRRSLVGPSWHKDAMIAGAALHMAAILSIKKIGK